MACDDGIWTVFDVLSLRTNFTTKEYIKWLVGKAILNGKLVSAYNSFSISDNVVILDVDINSDGGYEEYGLARVKLSMLYYDGHGFITLQEPFWTSRYYSWFDGLVEFTSGTEEANRRFVTKEALSEMIITHNSKVYRDCVRQFHNIRSVVNNILG